MPEKIDFVLLMFDKVRESKRVGAGAGFKAGDSGWYGFPVPISHGHKDPVKNLMLAPVNIEELRSFGSEAKKTSLKFLLFGQGLFVSVVTDVQWKWVHRPTGTRLDRMCLPHDARNGNTMSPTTRHARPSAPANPYEPVRGSRQSAQRCGGPQSGQTQWRFSDIGRPH